MRLRTHTARTSRLAKSGCIRLFELAGGLIKSLVDVGHELGVPAVSDGVELPRGHDDALNGASRFYLVRPRKLLDVIFERYRRCLCPKRWDVHYRELSAVNQCFRLGVRGAQQLDKRRQRCRK